MSEPIYFSHVKLIDGTFAEVADEVARRAITGGVHFIGITTTELGDMMTISQVVINGETYSLQNGDIVLYNREEYIYASSDGKVHLFGKLPDTIVLPTLNASLGENDVLELVWDPGSIVRS